MLVACVRLSALAIIFCLALTPARAQTEIGGAISAQNRVEGEIDGLPHLIEAGVRVYQDERVTTHADSGASFRFNDDTTMSMGQISEVVLDHFVYDPNSSSGDIIFNAAKGAFRFVTGNAASESYRIVTPTAVIGTRGTDFDVYVTGRGTLTLGREGIPFACPRRMQNELDPARTECCVLDVSQYGGPVYGILKQGSDECIGPKRWDGTNPMLLLARETATPLDRGRDRDSDDDDHDSSSSSPRSNSTPTNNNNNNTGNPGRVNNSSPDNSNAPGPSDTTDGPSISNTDG